jgi:hypothetical protein
MCWTIWYTRCEWDFVENVTVDQLALQGNYNDRKKGKK